MGHGYQPMYIGRNEIVPVEIGILPSSTLFRRGESLQVVIQGTDLFEHCSLAHTYSVNEGIHSIYTGAEYDSHLLVPMIPRSQKIMQRPLLIQNSRIV